MMRRKALVQFTYLVTKDLVEALRKKLSVAIDERTAQEIRTLEEKFLGKFWRYIPSKVDKVSFSAEEITKDLFLMVKRRGSPLVSLDRVYFPEAESYVDVTRLTSQRTGMTTIAERPGAISLQEQLKDLRKYNRISIGDVGAFEGKTLLEVCAQIERYGIEIDEIFLAFSGNSASKTINSRRKLNVLKTYEFYEWVELRDFFGIDGRNVGMKEGKRQVIPYWEELNAWASIAPENVEEVKLLCRESSNALTDLLSTEGYDVSKKIELVNLNREVKI